MSLVKIYEKDSIAGFTDDARCEYVVVFQLAAGTAAPVAPTLTELFKLWLASPKIGAKPQRRCILFFPRAAADWQAVASKFAVAAVEKGYWGALGYWNVTNPALSGRFFPTESFDVLQWRVRLTPPGVWPNSLDDLDVTWNGTRLIFKPKGANIGWQLTDLKFKPIADSPELAIDFNARAAGSPESRHVRIGALAFTFVYFKDLLPKLPVECSFSNILPGDDEEFRVERALPAKAVLELSNTHTFELALDPRDHGVTEGWSQILNSRLEFSGRTSLVTHYINDQGLNVILLAGEKRSGFARLHQKYDAGTRPGGRWNPDEAPEGNFVLEGEFAVGGVAGKIPHKNAVYRLMLGKTPQEHFESRVDHVLTFEGGNAAVMEDSPAQGLEAANDSLFHDAGGFLTTSYLKVRKGEGTENDSQGATYVTETGKSPMFAPQKAAGNAQTPAPLERKYVRYGRSEKAVPVLPWAGLPQGRGLEAAGKVRDYDSSHFARQRRIKLKDKTKPIGLEAEKSAELGVTPQGLIAGIDERGGYSTLFFGDPNGSKGAKAEFKIEFDPAGAQDIYDGIQQALRSDNLFLPVYNPAPAAITVFKASAVMMIGDFKFEIDLLAKANPLVRGVLLIKYFKGKSLSELVKDTQLWSLKQYFAPGAEAQNAIESAAKLDGTNVPDFWDQPEWQGIVLFNFLPTGMPDIFEALQPGMGKTGLRFHHFGLNFLPVRSGDLPQAEPGKPPAVPARQGSAFGLLRYTPQHGETPLVPETKEPERPEETPPEGDRYGFTVKHLQVRFENSQIKEFDAKLEIGLPRLFWDETDANSRKIELDGSYEARPDAQGGGTQDVFRLITAASKSITFKNSWIEEFSLKQAELSVLTSARSDYPRDENNLKPPYQSILRHLEFFIGITGTLKFKKLLPTELDLFKVKSITLERFGLKLVYEPEIHKKALPGFPAIDQNGSFTCGFHSDGVRVDVDFGGTRDSLLSILPLKLKGFKFAVGKMFEMKALGFTTVFSKLPDLKFHFALEFEFDLGFLGALSGMKGLKLPLMIGWGAGGPAGHLGFGIQFPTYSGEINIGIQQFIAIRAAKAELTRCPKEGEVQSIAIVLNEARLAFFGKIFPEKAKLNFAIFIPVKGERKMAWLFGIESEDSAIRYIGAGHRVRVPAGNTAAAIIANCKKDLQLGPGKDVCALVSDQSNDSWLIAGVLKLSELGEARFVVCDKPAIYALGLTIDLGVKTVEIEACYRRVNDSLGIFSAEINLAKLLPPLNFGAVSLRLGAIRVESHTDGGWLIDLGFPWDNDFRRSFQFEMGIYMGSGGFYFGVTSAAAADILLLENESYGYKSPKNHPLFATYGGQVRAARMGQAFRVGIGRSIDLGILKGEASITLYGITEGALAFRIGSSPTVGELFAFRTFSGIMVHIWAELDFFVLQAKAEILAYAQFGFELRRVLAVNADGKLCRLDLPFTVIAEVGIRVHFEVWITILCVRVKLFDLTFSATWHMEFTIGGLKELPARVDGHPETAAVPRLEAARAIDPPFKDRPGFAALVDVLELFPIILPCAADPEDFQKPAGAPISCLVSHLLMEVHDGFRKMAKFLVAWALNMPAKAGAQPNAKLDDKLDPKSRVLRSDVVAARTALREKVYWSTNGARILDAFQQYFDVKVTPFPTPNPNAPAPKDKMYVAVSAWSSIAWRFKGQPDVPPARLPVAFGGQNDASAVAVAQVDYLRLVTESFLREFDRLIRAEYTVPGAKPEDKPVHVPDDPGAFLEWGAIWDVHLNK